jgi:hypothetical protein
MENALVIGNAELWASLETSSYIYATYGASVGLQENAGTQLGGCRDISFERTQDVEAVELGNVVDSGIYEITSEENTLTFSAMEWRPDVIGIAFGVTAKTVTATDSVVIFGGGCNVASRPIVVQGENVSCNAADITNLTDGVEFAVLTLYDCYSSEGATLPFSASEDAPLDITMRCKPVLSLSRGERIGNLYLATD